MRLRALIVDDEYPARNELRYLLQPFEFINVVGEATNSVEARELIDKVDYAVIFLDIDMPGLNGIELAEQLKHQPNAPAVIFITAHESFALAAFSTNATDYLLKPVNPERLAEALDKVRRRFDNSSTAQQLAQQLRPGDEPENESADGPESRLPVKSGKESGKGPGNTPETTTNSERETKPTLASGLIPVDYQGKTILLQEMNIIYAYAENDYVYVKTFDNKYLTRFTLKELESRLNPNIFFRSHRRYLVNIRKTKELVPFFNGTYTIIVEDKEKSEVPVSRTQSKKLRELLGI